MSDTSELLAMLARDPNVTPDKMKMAVDFVVNERRAIAEREFAAAFLTLQHELPTISENGALMRDGKQIAKYSQWEDIQRVILPLLHKHGFTLSFSNGFPSPNEIEVVAALTHLSGHHAENAFRLRKDDTGQKNDNQAMASSQTYAMRYATVGLLCIVTAGSDACGEVSVTVDLAGAPSGYAAALAKLHKTAAKGTASLARAIKKLDAETWEFLALKDKDTYANLKAIAASVTA